MAKPHLGNCEKLDLTSVLNSYLDINSRLGLKSAEAFLLQLHTTLKKSGDRRHTAAMAPVCIQKHLLVRLYQMIVYTHIVTLYDIITAYDTAPILAGNDRECLERAFDHLARRRQAGR